MQIRSQYQNFPELVRQTEGFQRFWTLRTVALDPTDTHYAIVTPLACVRPCATIPAMAVNPELLKILVCPLCKAAVAVVHDGKGLKCSQCHRVYPIRDDIPVMLVSEAKVEN